MADPHEHPLFQELKSLKAAVDRFQAEAHTNALKLQHHALESTRFLQIQRTNEQLEHELSILRANPHPDSSSPPSPTTTTSALPSSSTILIPSSSSKSWTSTSTHPAAIHARQLTLSLRTLSARLTELEHTLLQRTADLTHAHSSSLEEKLKAENAYGVCARLRGREEAANQKVREVEWQLRRLGEEKRVVEVAVGEYADLVRELEGRKRRGSSASVASAGSGAESGLHENGGATVVTQIDKALFDAKAGVEGVLDEFEKRVVALEAQLDHERAKAEMLQAELEASQKANVQLESLLTSTRNELDLLKVEDNTAAKMVSRYMQFSQKSTNALQTSLKTLTTRHAATVNTLTSQSHSLQTQLRISEANAARLRGALDELGGEMMRETMGRRREVALRMRAVGREEKMREALARWLRRCEEAWRRMQALEEDETDVDADADATRSLKKNDPEHTRGLLLEMMQEAKTVLTRLDDGVWTESSMVSGSLGRVLLIEGLVDGMVEELNVERAKRVEFERRWLEAAAIVDVGGNGAGASPPEAPSKRDTESVILPEAPPLVSASGVEEASPAPESGPGEHEPRHDAPATTTTTTTTIDRAEKEEVEVVSLTPPDPVSETPVEVEAPLEEPSTTTTTTTNAPTIEDTSDTPSSSSNDTNSAELLSKMTTTIGISSFDNLEIRPEVVVDVEEEAPEATLTDEGDRLFGDSPVATPSLSSSESVVIGPEERPEPIKDVPTGVPSKEVVEEENGSAECSTTIPSLTVPEPPVSPPPSTSTPTLIDDDTKCDDQPQPHGAILERPSLEPEPGPESPPTPEAPLTPKPPPPPAPRVVDPPVSGRPDSVLELLEAEPVPEPVPEPVVVLEEPQPHPLLIRLQGAQNRYQDLQRAFRDCHAALENLKENVAQPEPHAQSQSSVISKEVLDAILQRLDDYIKDIRVELEIQVEDEVMARKGWEMVLSLNPSAFSTATTTTLLSNGGIHDDDDDQSDVGDSDVRQVEREIEAYLDGRDPAFKKARGGFERKLGDVEHDVAAVKRWVHEGELQDQVLSDEHPTSTDTPTAQHHHHQHHHIPPPLASPGIQRSISDSPAPSGGWTSWIRGNTNSRPSTPRSASSAPPPLPPPPGPPPPMLSAGAGKTFGDIMTSPRVPRYPSTHQQLHQQQQQQQNQSPYGAQAGGGSSRRGSFVNLFLGGGSGGGGGSSKAVSEKPGPVEMLGLRVPMPHFASSSNSTSTSNSGYSSYPLTPGSATFSPSLGSFGLGGFGLGLGGHFNQAQGGQQQQQPRSRTLSGMYMLGLGGSSSSPGSSPSVAAMPAAGRSFSMGVMSKPTVAQAASTLTTPTAAPVSVGPAVKKPESDTEEEEDSGDDTDIE